MIRKAARFLVTGVLIALIVWAVDIGIAFERILDIDPIIGLLVFVLLLIQYDVATTRWSKILSTLEDDFPHWRLLKIHYMGMFAQIFLPASVGGAAVRAWMIHREGMSLPGAINSVIVDRLFATAGLVSLTVLMSPYLAFVLFTDSIRQSLKLYTIMTIVGGIALTLVFSRWPITFWLHLLEKSFIGPVIGYLRESGGRLLRIRFIASTLGITLVAQFLTVISIYTLAQGTGIQVNLIDCIFLLPPVMLLASLPISVSGWGVREGAMIVAFGFIGVSQEAALTLSLQFALLGTAASLIGAIGWLQTIDSTVLRELKAFKSRG